MALAPGGNICLGQTHKHRTANQALEATVVSNGPGCGGQGEAAWVWGTQAPKDLIRVQRTSEPVEETLLMDKWHGERDYLGKFHQ